MKVRSILNIVKMMYDLLIFLQKLLVDILFRGMLQLWESKANSFYGRHCWSKQIWPIIFSRIIYVLNLDKCLINSTHAFKSSQLFHRIPVMYLVKCVDCFVGSYSIFVCMDFNNFLAKLSSLLRFQE